MHATIIPPAIAVIHLAGAGAVARFTGDYVAGLPAVTRHTFGSGVSYYVGTELEADGLAWLLDRVCAEAKLTAPVSPRGVEMVARQDDHFKRIEPRGQTHRSAPTHPPA